MSEVVCIFDSRASASYGERKKKKGFFLSLSLSPSFVFFTWLGTISHA